MDILMNFMLKPFLILTAVLCLFYLCYSKLRPLRLKNIEENESIITEIDIKQSFNHDKINKIQLICNFLADEKFENNEAMIYYRQIFNDLLIIIRKSIYSYDENKSFINFSAITNDFILYCKEKNINFDFSL